MVLHLKDPISAAGGDGDSADPPRLLSHGAIEIDELLHPPLDVIGLPLRKSTVTIRNHRELSGNGGSTLIIFPPIDHENLAVSQDSGRIPSIAAESQKIPLSDTATDSDSDSSSSSTFSPSVSSSEQISTFPSSIRRASASGWLCSITELFRCRAMYLLRLFSDKFSSSREILVTYRSAAFVTVVMVVVLYFRRRRRRAGILKERDEKINQLLDQMSLLNQILLEMHRDRRSSAAT